MHVVGLLLAGALALPSPAELPTLPRLMYTAKPVYCAGMRGRNVALTFDDGPSPYTQRLVRVLGRAHARATFFVVGNRIELWPAAVRASTRVGDIGNHTWSHPHLGRLSPNAVRLELERTQRAIAREIGSVPRVFRPPYEEATAADDRVVRALGLLDVRWNADSGDSRPHARPAGVLRRVKAALRPGAIILLHDPHPWTARVVRLALREARRRGLRAVTVSELLARQPPARHQLSTEGVARCLQ